MGFVNTRFGSYGYIELSAGQTVTGSFQLVKCRGLSPATVSLIAREGDNITDLIINPLDDEINQFTQVSCSLGAVLVYLNAPNYTIT